MGSSSDIFRAIRTEVFRETQTKFGKKLQLSKETVCRLEKHTGHHHVTGKHLRVLRQIPAPPHQGDRYHALLDELAKAIEEESRPEGYLEEQQRRLAEEARRLEELRKTEEAARLAQETLQNAEQLRVASEARLTEQLQRAQDTVQLAQEALLRTEELRLADETRRAHEARQQKKAEEQAEQARRNDEARRAEQLRQAEESAWRAEHAAQRTEQLYLAEKERREQETREREKLGKAVRRAEDAAERVEHAEATLADEARRREEASKDAAQRTTLERRRVKRLLFLSTAASVVLSVGGVGAVLAFWQPLRVQTAPLAQAGSSGASAHPSPALDPDGEEDETQSLTGGLDGGTGIVRLVNQASPMPTHPLRKQHAAPCPEGIDEFNGYCWMKLSLTPAQIKAGACEEEGMYEPSPGWCREHNAGYRPYRGGRPGTSVDPQ